MWLNELGDKMKFGNHYVRGWKGERKGRKVKLGDGRGEEGWGEVVEVRG